MPMTLRIGVVTMSTGKWLTIEQNCLLIHNFNQRFADRDLLMHYCWGLGVGHIYSHGQTAPGPLLRTHGSLSNKMDSTPELITDNIAVIQPAAFQADSDLDNPVDDLDGNDLEDSEEASDDFEEASDDFEEASDECSDDDVMVLTMDKMYGWSNLDDCE